MVLLRKTISKAWFVVITGAVSGLCIAIFLGNILHAIF